MLSLLTSPVLLAPMAGVNDAIFRLICKKMGAGLTYTEMISSKGLEYNSSKTTDMLFALPEENPVAVQLFGHEANSLAAQAAALEERMGASLALIDINMACPVRKVAGKGDGAALLLEPELATNIIKKVSAAISKPLTIKIRKGYYDSLDVAVEFAKLAEQNGASAIGIHGRSAQQLYRGKANREIIAQAASAVRIPVIASGDVYAQADVQDYMNNFGAAAVMVARGAQGNPWIFSSTRDTTAKPSVQERVAIVSTHLYGIAQHLPWRLSSMRKHIAWYFKSCANASTIRRDVNKCVALEDYERLLDRIVLDTLEKVR